MDWSRDDDGAHADEDEETGVGIVKLGKALEVGAVTAEDEGAVVAADVVFADDDNWATPSTEADGMNAADVEVCIENRRGAEAPVVVVAAAETVAPVVVETGVTEEDSNNDGKEGLGALKPEKAATFDAAEVVAEAELPNPNESWKADAALEAAAEPLKPKEGWKEDDTGVVKEKEEAVVGAGADKGVAVAVGAANVEGVAVVDTAPDELWENDRSLVKENEGVVLVDEEEEEEDDGGKSEVSDGVVAVVEEEEADGEGKDGEIVVLRAEAAVVNEVPNNGEPENSGVLAADEDEEDNEAPKSGGDAAREDPNPNSEVDEPDPKRGLGEEEGGATDEEDGSVENEEERENAGAGEVVDPEKRLALVAAEEADEGLGFEEPKMEVEEVVAKEKPVEGEEAVEGKDKDEPKGEDEEAEEDWAGEDTKENEDDACEEEKERAKGDVEEEGEDDEGWGLKEGTGGGWNWDKKNGTKEAEGWEEEEEEESVEVLKEEEGAMPVSGRHCLPDANGVF